jgi:hypothetical protein
VAWLTNCQQAYEEMTSRDRRLMSQAFFRAIWVTEDGVVGWEYNQPFAALVHAHGAREPIFGAVALHEAKSRRKAGYEGRSPGRMARASLRRGLNQITLAEGVGFEPTVTCATMVFETIRFGRSRIPPGGMLRHGRGGSSTVLWVIDQPRRAAKNRSTSVAHSSLRTPGTTGISWLSRGSAARL